MTDFKDHFSSRAAEYAKFRPVYPPALSAWLAGLVDEPRTAVDVATGNGQAAVALAAHFARVVAIDASPSQIAHATPHPRVEYLVRPGEATGLADGSADLVTVAQALHWLRHDAFFAEVRRILRPGGVVAAWGYANATIAPDVDPTLEEFYAGFLGPYWPAERAIVNEHYRGIELPFPAVPAPPFALEQAMSRDGFAGYVGTWSAVKHYREATGRDPDAELRPTLDAGWPAADTIRLVRWPLFLRVGRKP